MSKGTLQTKLFITTDGKRDVGGYLLPSYCTGLPASRRQELYTGSYSEREMLTC